jgi:peptidoglycan/LPS O-acetylase OafA/YrhL
MTKNVPSKKNNFDLMRIILASIVCLVHINEISNIESLGYISDILSSYVAVKIFFVISGFLIFMSYDRSENLAVYFRNRFFRIYPAYFFVILISSILLPIIFGHLSSENGLAILNYIFWNLLFLNFMSPNLPGVFSGNEIAAVNGALWTLKIEVMFYISVPIIGYIMSKTNRNAVLGSIYVISIIYVYALESFIEFGGGIGDELKRQLPGQMSYFVSGAILYYNFDKFMRKYLILAAASVLMIIFVPDTLNSFVEPIVFGIITISIAYSIYFGPWAKFGDFSYGVYITHFPIVQTLVALGVAEKGGGVFAVSALLLTGLISVGLWHGIEKRYLGRGRRTNDAVGHRQVGES